MNKITRTFSLASKNNKEHDFFCKKCNQETDHSIISSYDENHEYEDIAVFWQYKNQIIQCLGCKTVSFCCVSFFSEDEEYYDDGRCHCPTTIKYYPERSAILKSIPIDVFSLPQKIQKSIKKQYRQLKMNCIF